MIKMYLHIEVKAMDFEKITDQELTLLLRGIRLLNNCVISSSERKVVVRIRDEMRAEVVKRSKEE